LDVLWVVMLANKLVYCLVGSTAEKMDAKWVALLVARLGHLMADGKA
jgi:hypothetical protein